LIVLYLDLALFGLVPLVSLSSNRGPLCLAQHQHSSRSNRSSFRVRVAILVPFSRKSPTTALFLEPLLAAPHCFSGRAKRRPFDLDSSTPDGAIDIDPSAPLSFQPHSLTNNNIGAAGAAAIGGALKDNKTLTTLL